MKATRLKELILHVTEKTGPVSRLKLAKLVYLIDWSFYRRHGRPLTKAYYLRERRGPVPATFGKDLEEMMGFEIELKRGAVAPGIRRRFTPSFDEAEASVIDEVLRRYGRRSERDLLVATYVSKPMKALLKEERAGSVRKHEGISFGRFPSEAHDRGSADRDEAPAEGRFEYVAPGQITAGDTRELMLGFLEALPLVMTAQELLGDDMET
ncbi:MAG: SocA family protein [Candidatus Rokubacteria bacterium]|nr:SocA family protein [Candidatus Rokubacteria bacterium]